MPRGQSEAVLRKHWLRAGWNSLPTATVRVPVVLGEQVRAIAQWADQQSDPVAAMQQLLDWIANQETEDERGKR